MPELKDEVRGLITPGKNPWFEHAEAAFFLAWREGRREPVGRISAQVDQLVLEHMGAGIGQWGMFEAEDEAVAARLARRGGGLASRQGHDPLDGPLLASASGTSPACW